MRKGRRSVFKEVRLDDDLEYPEPSSAPTLLPGQDTTTHHGEREIDDNSDPVQTSQSTKRDYKLQFPAGHQAAYL